MSPEVCPTPLVHVSDGIIRSANLAFREAFADLGATGTPWLALFAAASADELVRLASQGWFGISERLFAIRDGRWVSLLVTLAEDGMWVALHDCSARQQLEAAADQQRRMEAVGELASAIAREMNDPMSIVQGRLELVLALGDRADPAATARHLLIALEHARRVSATLRNLRLVGRSASPVLEVVEVSDAIEEALALVGPRGKQVDVKITAGMQVGGDLSRIARVVANVLRRALDLSPRLVRLVARRGRDDVEIEIGPGPGWTGRVDRDVRSPSADMVDRTLLASVGARVEELHGSTGPSWAILLPPPPAPRARSRRMEGRIVVVGRPELHDAVHGLVTREGFEVIPAADADSALEALEGGQVDGLVTELFLAGASGIALAAEVIRRAPSLRNRVILVTDVRLASPPPDVHLIHPPLRRGAVLEALGRRVRRP